MNINTQRKSIWVTNFVILGALTGLFLLMVLKENPAARHRELVATLADLDKAMSIGRMKTPPPRKSDSLDTLRDKTFYPFGYVKPPEVKPTAPRGTRTAPPLESLIELVMVVAPTGETGGGNERAGVLVKVKSKGTSFYRIGETIGTGPYDDTPVLNEWGGAKIVRVEQKPKEPLSLVCLWGKPSREVVVKMAEAIPRGMTVEGLDGIVGAFGESEGPRGVPGGGAALGEFHPGQTRGRLNISTDGLASLEGNGQSLMDGVAFQKAETPQNKDALRIKRLPAEFGEYGLREGDVIIRIDNRMVTSKESIISYVRSTYTRKPSYNVTFLRDGRQRTLWVTVPRNTKSQRRLY